ncbi:MAG TPA: ArsR family transcriptional regulator [Planctomycetaceae bacterium]|jgi:DNA-binding transcriptional ArsR family regulator|nr:ArsR family transcriptional regulator [Planctomycetaceae bacterium]
MPDKPTDSFRASFCAERLKALSDPHRLRIIDALRPGELTVSDLAELLETELVTISHHLKVMKYAQLVSVRREGRFMYYNLHPDLRVSGPRAARTVDLGCCRIEVPEKSRS